MKQDTSRLVVFTGDEPLLQLDKALIDALHKENSRSRRHQTRPAGIDWLCVSPKADSEVVLTHGNELKLVYPQPLAMPERFPG